MPNEHKKAQWSKNLKNGYIDPVHNPKMTTNGPGTEKYIRKKGFFMQKTRPPKHKF